MADRMDIDALLIGALYGELTPADEARLTAHLESHPSDRNALADLTRTRAQLRDSGALSVELEPPQSVSALLLQEAARRAPRPQREAESWFHRFARSFMAHPAMAAAATLVIVVGVAGALYVRHGAELTQSRAPSLASEGADRRIVESLPATPHAAAQAPEGEGEGATTGPKGRDKDAYKDAYDVGLAEATRQQGKADRERQVQKTRVTSDGESDRVVARDEAKEVPADTLDRFSSPPTRTAIAEQKAQKKAAGIELRSPEMAPRELETNEKTNEKNKVAGAKRGAGYAGGGRNRDELGNAASADSDDLAPASKSPAPATALLPPSPPKAQPVAPAPEPIAPLRSGPSKPLVTGNTGTASNAGSAPRRADGKDAKLDSNAPDRKAAPRAAQAPAPSSNNVAAGAAPGPGNERVQADSPPASAPGAPPAVENTLAQQTDKTNASLLGWARTRHDQVVALVRSSNCRGAATAAIEIYNRAPDYYATNVATDRSVKPCLPYLNSERQREDRQRAVKRANASDAPSQAAPPVKK